MKLEEFNKLSEKDKCDQYKKLSEKDKFKVRLSMLGGYEIVGHRELTKEDEEITKKMKAEFNEMKKKGTQK